MKQGGKDQSVVKSQGVRLQEPDAKNRCWSRVRRAGRLAALALLGCLTLGGVTSLLPRRWGAIAPRDDCRYTIYVSGGVMHTSLIVPVYNSTFDWRQHLDLSDLGQHSTSFQYLQFGWGDRTWYIETPTWSDANLLSGLRALVLQNPAALFVTGHPQVPRYPGETVKCVGLSETDYQALVEFIDHSFKGRLARKQRIPLPAERWGAFYEATGRYSLLRTCNAWTADALHAANVTTPLWGSLAPAVMRQIRNGCACQGPEQSKSRPFMHLPGKGRLRRM